MALDQTDPIAEPNTAPAVEQTAEPNTDDAAIAGFFNQVGAGTLAERMGITITEATRDRVVGTMPVEGNTQPYGLLHGGASVVLAETLGSVSSALHAGPDKLVVGVDINATHHRSAETGTVTGVATPIHVGRTLVVHEIVISDEQGRRLCTSRLTCLIKES